MHILVGTSITSINNRISSLGITASVDYLQRDELILPSTFTTSNLNNFTNNIYANNTKIIIGATGTPLSYTKQLINSTDGTSQTEYRGTAGCNWKF